MNRYDIIHPNGYIHVWESEGDPQQALEEWVETLHEDVYCFTEDCSIALSQIQGEIEHVSPTRVEKPWRKRVKVKQKEPDAEIDAKEKMRRSLPQE